MQDVYFLLEGGESRHAVLLVVVQFRQLAVDNMTDIQPFCGYEPKYVVNRTEGVCPNHLSFLGG